MRYLSTRGESPPVPFTEAIMRGLAPDGGLYLPESLPDISPRLRSWRNLSYAPLCAEFLNIFATDLPEDVLTRIVHRGYATFLHPEIAPLRRLDRSTAVLELFHGPTLAFKDFALQPLGGLMAWIAEQRGATVNVLGATSGDTGAAAIHALRGHANAASFILYPEGRIAPLQERQMACTGAANVHAIAIEGSFDDAQRIVKDLLGDVEFSAAHRLAAANSINLARILAQSVYYLHAWLRLDEGERDRAEFVVPTGNFGNVLAGWLLTGMGVPIPSFCVATNRNDSLHRFFSSGEYRADVVHATLAPSMDIQVASNFERWLYYASDEDPARTSAAVAALSRGEQVRLPASVRASFRSTSTTDAEIVGAIKDAADRFGYTIDPHTACAWRELDPERFSIVLATAHPAKFPETMRSALAAAPTHPSLEDLKSRQLKKVILPAESVAVRNYVAAHARTV
jgi:threonine synthase